MRNLVVGTAGPPPSWAWGQVEYFLFLLGIAIDKQLHGSLRVGEASAYLLTLAFNGGTRGRNPVGEVPWRGGYRGLKSWIREPRAAREYGAATTAESLRDLIVEAAW